MKTMRTTIDANAATLAGLQIDLLQKVRSGQITLNQLERFNNLSSADREKLFSKGGGKRSALSAVLDHIKDAGYLDTSFEGKEVHPLTIRPLTKEQAINEYRNSGGKTWIWDELKKNMPYAMPKAETLDVMIMNFGKSIGSDEALAEMDKLGVRPLTYEELIQYGITHPDHQEQEALVGLGTKHTLVGYPHAPGLGSGVDERGLSADDWGDIWDGRCRFPVVRKGKPGDYNYFLDS